MATLQNIVTKEIIYLNTQHSFGRNKHICNTPLSEKDISQLHAIIQWKTNAWHLNDQSRNGTLISGKFTNNNTVKIELEDIIQFGSNEITKWKVLELNAPTSYLKSVTNNLNIIELNSSHALPNEENPDTFIYPIDDTWVIEKNGISKKMEPNTTYLVDGEKFLFVENRIIEDTMDMGISNHNSFFRFTLSHDEEHIHISLITRNLNFDLGERIHNYILLALVRKKLSDHRAKYSEIDLGWMDVNQLLEELSKELHKEIDIYYLNLKIHRIRKLMLDIKPYGHLLTTIIERRPGQIRFSHPYFEIIKDKKSIGEILPS